MSMTTLPTLTLGWRLRMSLEHATVSVQQMADELGVTRQTLSRWMHDEGAPPRAAFVKQWALRTSVPYVWLATGDVPDDGGAALRWFTASNEVDPDQGVLFLAEAG